GHDLESLASLTCIVHERLGWRWRSLAPSDVEHEDFTLPGRDDFLELALLVFLQQAIKRDETVAERLAHGLASLHRLDRRIDVPVQHERHVVGAALDRGAGFEPFDHA